MEERRAAGRRPGYTLITEEELQRIPSAEIAVELVNQELIQPKSADYLLNYISLHDFSGEALDTAVSLCLKTIKLLHTQAPAYWSKALDFLRRNRTVNVPIFRFVLSGITDSSYDKTPVSNYVNSLPAEALNEEYLEMIDDHIIDATLSESVTSALKAQKLYAAVLSFWASADRLKDKEVDFTDRNLAHPIIDACVKLLEHKNGNLIAIRRAIVRQFVFEAITDQLCEDYQPLFFGEFPVISLEEMTEIPSGADIVKLLDRSKIQKGNSRTIASALSGKVSRNRCMEFLRSLFSAERDDRFESAETIEALIRELDLKAIGFSALNNSDQAEAMKLLSVQLGLSIEETEKAFMKWTGCPISYLE